MSESGDEELYCKLCGLGFDETNRVPLIIPDCGHSFCSICIKKKLESLHPEETFMCPIDKAVFFTTRRDINQFPKNYSILRLLEQEQGYSYKISSGFPENNSKFTTISALIKSPQEALTANQSKYEISFGAPNKSSPNNSYIGTTASPNTSLREQYKVRLSISSTKSSNNPETRPTLCVEHSKFLDLFCLEHKTRICSNCALFGAHRNHDVQSEENVANAVADRAERLLEIFDVLDSKQKLLFTALDIERLKKDFSVKSEEIKSIVKDFFHKWTESIRIFEKEVTADMTTKFKLIEKSIDEANKFPIDELLLKVQEWKSA